MNINRKTGFTLLEMLMVISIMILLMGMAGVSVGAAIQAAKKTKARAETAELVRAWKSYHKTYGKWPDSFSVAGAIQSKAMDKYNIEILTGKNENPKKIKFIDLAYSDSGLEDPWGQLYVVYFNETQTDAVEHYQTTVFFPAAKRYIYEKEY